MCWLKFGGNAPPFDTCSSPSARSSRRGSEVRCFDCTFVASLPETDVATQKTVTWWIQNLTFMAGNEFRHVDTFHQIFFIAILGPVHMRFQVPSPIHVHLTSPNMEAKSQLLRLKKPIKIWLMISKVGSWFFNEIFLWGLLLRVGSSSLLDPT
jgi:hypothetical protein